MQTPTQISTLLLGSTTATTSHITYLTWKKSNSLKMRWSHLPGKYPLEGVQNDPSLSDRELQEKFSAFTFLTWLAQPFDTLSLTQKLRQFYNTLPRLTWATGGTIGSNVCNRCFSPKDPKNPGQAWHQDEIYIPTRDRSLIGAWIAVDDATVDNGCLWVLPGSHKPGHLYQQRQHNNPDFDFAGESYGFDDSSEIPVEVKAGSVVFFNGYLLHRSKPNKTNGFRRSLVNHYMSASSFLPWNVDDHKVTNPCRDNFSETIELAPGGGEIESDKERHLNIKPFLRMEQSAAVGVTHNPNN